MEAGGRSVVDAVAVPAGKALAALTAVASAARPAIRPLHPEGVVAGATIRRDGLADPTGVPWLDSPGDDGVRVRLSRAAGFPRPLPDVHGLAIRVPVNGDAVADLLLSTTGSRPLARHLLAPGWSAHRPMTSLLPYRTFGGPLLLGAFPQEPGVFSLCVATLLGPWRRFGEVHVGPAPGDDDELRFDPVLNTLPGLEHYRWVQAVRAPSYAAARSRSLARGAARRAPGAAG